MAGNAHPRVVGYITAADYSAAFATWKIGADTATAGAPTVAQRSQGGLFGWTCRVFAGTELSVDQQASSSMTQPATAATGKRKVKMASAIHQGDENEADVLDGASITAAYAEYNPRVGAFPKTKSCLSNSSAG